MHEVRRVTMYATYPGAEQVEECLETLESEHDFYYSSKLAIRNMAKDEQLYRVQVVIERMEP